MKMTFLYTLIIDKKTEGEKKVFFFKVYTKVECYLKKIGVLVFSFMYLVSVDPMDRSKNIIFLFFLRVSKFQFFSDF